MTALLEVRGLNKSFAEFAAISGVDLELPGGGVTAVIGPNGAGKTTFINLLTGKLSPDAGRIAFAGADVTHLSASARVRAGMARTFQVTNVFPLLSAEQNVAVPVLARAGKSLESHRRLDSMQDVHESVRKLLATVGLADRAAQQPDLASQLEHAVLAEPLERRVRFGHEPAD